MITSRNVLKPEHSNLLNLEKGNANVDPMDPERSMPRTARLSASGKRKAPSRSSSLKSLLLELFWPFETFSWRPVRARNGATELTLSMRLRTENRSLGVRWLILSGCFLLAAGVASTVLLLLGGISAVIGLMLLFIDRRTRTAIPEAGADVVQDSEPGSRRQSPESHLGGRTH